MVYTLIIVDLIEWLSMNEGKRVDKSIGMRRKRKINNDNNEWG